MQKSKNFTYMTEIPKPLNGYNLYKVTMSIAYFRNKHIHCFVHFSDNLFSYELILHDIKNLCIESSNGILKNYVCFYSPMIPDERFTKLEKEHDNFVYYHQPLMTFAQVPFYLDVDLLPTIANNYEKNFCCLANRATYNRYKLFNFLKENDFLNLGFVSYRNCNRYNKTHEYILPEPYINFEDNQYTEQMTDDDLIPYLWEYPFENFLFDISIDTFNEGVPFLTEKSTKGFIWGKVPLSTGSKNLMHYLEQLGFDIFRDIINYNYDIQNDNNLRMDLFMEQVEKVVKVDISTIHNLEQRLDYNKTLICKLIKRSQVIYENINVNVNFILKNRDKFLGY